METYRNFILSSPKPLFVDTLGNPLWFTYTALERLPAGVVGKIRQGLFHSGADGAVDAVQFKEAQIMFSSYMESITAGISYLGKAVKEVDPDLTGVQKARAFGKGLSEKLTDVRTDTQTRFDAPRGEQVISAKSFGVKDETVLGKFINTTGAVINSPTAFMQGKDDVMKAVMFRASSKARAYRKGVELGLEGDDLNKFIDEIMKELDPKIKLKDQSLADHEVNDFLTKLADVDLEGLDAFKQAVDGGQNIPHMARKISNKSVEDAQRATFTDELEAPVKSFSKAVNSLPGGAVIFPFIKTPTKLLWSRFLAERTPVGLITKQFWKEIQAGGARADMAVGQLATGTSLMFMFYNMALNGRITGDGPSNTAEREALLRTGWRPRSILVGGEYIEIGRLDPIASLMLFPANFAELSHELENEIGADLENSMTDLMIMNIAAFARMSASKSWLASVGQLSDAIKSEDPNRARRLINFYAASFVVPNAVTFMRNAVDPHLAQSETLMQELRKRTGLEMFGEEIQRKDIFGNPVVRDPQMRNFVLPLSYSNILNDKLMQTMVEVGAYIPRPERRVFGVEITLQQHDRLMSIMKEQNVEGQMRQFIEQPIWDSLPETDETGIDGYQSYTKAGMLKEIYSRNLRAARERLVAEDKSLALRIEKFERNKQELGAGSSLGQATIEIQREQIEKKNIPSFNPSAD
jgi:hypothetical protein